MASKAQTNYAQSIVKYFDKHPEAGVDLDVNDVLENMNVWALRHKLHKEGHAWLSDDDLAAVTGEVARVGKRVLDRRDDVNRAHRHRIRTGRADEAAAAEARAAWVAATERVEEARSLAHAAVRRLHDQYGPDHGAEIDSLAVSYGAV